MPTEKPITAARIRAVLRKAGFSASRNTGKSRIRGLPNRTAGFKVRESDDGFVVTHVGSDYTTPADVLAAGRAKYGDALTAAGIPWSDRGIDIHVERTPREGA